jgi:hypothetical protein
MEKRGYHYVETGRYKEKLHVRKKDVFGKEIKLILACLIALKLKFHATIFKLHITTGAREGQINHESGVTGFRWSNFKRDFTTLDFYESKVKGGIWNRGAPLTLFFAELPGELRKIWSDRGKPADGKLLLGGYDELTHIYKEIRNALSRYYQGQIAPDLFEQLTTIRPHDADKIHINMLWEAEIPLEVAVGKYLGAGEGQAYFGRIWLDLNTVKKHYLSLDEKGERFQKLRAGITKYSAIFREEGGAS